MRPYLVIAQFLLLASFSPCAEFDEKKGLVQASNSEIAVSAFEAVKEGLADDTLIDRRAMLSRMKQGFSVMQEFMELCDVNLLSDDEVSRSAAFLGVVAINSLRRTEQLEKWAEGDNVEVAKKFVWTNRPELKRLADDFKYQRMRLPSYTAHVARLIANAER